jgi:hypothetical protein
MSVFDEAAWEERYRSAPAVCSGQSRWSMPDRAGEVARAQGGTVHDAVVRARRWSG